MFDIYYKIMKDNTGISVICLQEFDEKDYNQNLFIKDKDGNSLIFTTEEEARKYINKNKLYIALFEEPLEILGLYTTKELAIKACEQHFVQKYDYIKDYKINDNIIFGNRTYITILSLIGEKDYSIFEEYII